MSEANHGSRPLHSWRRRLGQVVDAFSGAGRALEPDAQRQAELQLHLEGLLQPLAGQGDLGLAILEGALALAMADGQFDDNEWQLFQRGMALLDPQEQQRGGLSLQGEVDLEPVCAVLAALEDPEQRQAIAAFYRLLCEADGQAGAAEQRCLDRLLQALRSDHATGVSHGG